MIKMTKALIRLLFEEQSDLALQPVRPKVKIGCNISEKRCQSVFVQDCLTDFKVTVKLISAFVFATQIVQSLYFLNLKYQASSHLLWLYSTVRVGPGRKSRGPVFLQRGSYDVVVSWFKIVWQTQKQAKKSMQSQCLRIHVLKLIILTETFK